MTDTHDDELLEEDMNAAAAVLGRCYIYSYVR
jgi:hypothetical protein